MKLSNSFFITRKEDTKEDKITNLLIRSGMIYKYDNSTFFYLPMGLKVLENLKKIIREEHNKYGLEEVLMPSLVNQDIFIKSNRLNDEIFKFTSKEETNLCMCPTHEELFALLASYKIQSYRDLHFTLYQISNKYRDENKLSFLRKEEFIMCDSYSFDSSLEGLNISYDNMYHIYNNIFKRLNIDYLVCESNPLSMEGTYSEEFHYVTNLGNEKIVKCDKCTYTANRLVAECYYKKKEIIEKDKPNKKVYTPNVRSIIDVSKYLNIDTNNIIKSLIYKVNKDYKLILMRGNEEVNETKLSKLFKTNNIRLATNEEIINLGGEVGFIGPINTRLEVIADNNVKDIINGVCGSNEKDYHYINITPNIDFKVNKYCDLRIFDSKDICPICKEKCSIYKTIEVANIFKLGSKFSDDFKLKYSDEENKYNRVQMGSYGIGIERLLMACISSNMDDNGIIWPIDIAPYKVNIIIANVNDRDAYRYSNELYDKLNELNIETMLDDRKLSCSVKLKDNDLIGIPIRVVVGYKNSENIIEIKTRDNYFNKEINKFEVISTIKKLLNM